MNREIKFRGKLLKDSDSFKTYKKGLHIYGGFYQEGTKTYIVAHSNVFDVDPESVEQFTGFQECKGEDIYEGDDLGTWTIVDGHQMQTRQRVFWNQPTGSWHLDNSYKQDQSCSVELWLELQDFKFEVLNPEL